MELVSIRIIHIFCWTAPATVKVIGELFDLFFWPGGENEVPPIRGVSRNNYPFHTREIAVNDHLQCAVGAYEQNFGRPEGTGWSVEHSINTQNHNFTGRDFLLFDSDQPVFALSDRLRS